MDNQRLIDEAPAVSAHSPAPLIKVTKISKHFGGTVALHDASFTCARGSIHALVGENGAGKSTLVKILAGVVVADSGSIQIDGQELTIRSPKEAAALGIVPVFQELSLIPGMTAAENVFLARPPLNRVGVVDRRKLLRQTEQLFAELGFSNVDPSALISELPLAQQQLVEIAKAMSLRPRVLIMDEGTSALSARDVVLVFDMMRRIRTQGCSVIFISHRMDEVREIADSLTVFRDGTDVGFFPMSEVQEDQMVQLMIGRKLEQVFPPKPVPPPARRPLLDVNRLSWNRVLNDVSFSVGQGEIVGVGGLDGQGQSELLLALFGLLRNVVGEISIEGKPQHISSPAMAARAGINMAYIPEDRKTEGLILKMSVGANATMSVLNRLSRFGLINRQRERVEIDNVITRMQVKTTSAHNAIRNLSGGNQQKVVIGKWLITKAKLYLLHDPSRGIDIGTKQEIYRLMRNLADEGAGLLFFSTEVAELVGLCDRVLVFYEGKVIRELSGDRINEHNIVSAALGLQDSVKVSSADT